MIVAQLSVSVDGYLAGPSPSLEDPLGIGLAAGIIFDATVIRALLVPALMRLLGSWNWWLPARAARLLLVRRSGPEAAAAPESA